MVIKLWTFFEKFTVDIIIILSNLFKTFKIVKKHKLTALMITHSMTQALEYGDRTIMMYHGELVRDMYGSARNGLSSADLVKYFDL